MEQDKLKKIIEAAKLYYIFDYNQNEIAQKIGVSRPTVSRLLQQAKSEGIVQITIADPSEDIENLALGLEEKFGLKKAIVVYVPKYEDQIIKKYIGEASADYLYQIVKDDDVIGVAWGTTLYHVAQELKHKHVKDVKVVQLKGGISHSVTNTYASEIIQLFGKAYNTIPHHLPLPAIVDQAIVKQSMEADRHIRRILDLGKEANIAVLTVGTTAKDSILNKLGYLTKEDVEAVSTRAVGDICSRFFDKEGNVCCETLDDRTLGIELEELKRKETSILVAGGVKKVEGIQGALEGKIANVLITDQFTAKQLLER